MPWQRQVVVSDAVLEPVRLRQALPDPLGNLHMRQQQQQQQRRRRRLQQHHQLRQQRPPGASGRSRMGMSLKLCSSGVTAVASGPVCLGAPLPKAKTALSVTAQ